MQLSVKNLCRVFGANCVICSYNDKSAPFQTRFSVIHNFFVKFLQTIYFYKAESARKIDTPSKFSIYRMSHMIFEVEKIIFFDKQVENVIGPSYFTVKIIGL